MNLTTDTPAPTLPQHTIDAARTWIVTWWTTSKQASLLDLSATGSSEDFDRARTLSEVLVANWSDDEVLWLFAFVHLYGSAIGRLA